MVYWAGATNLGLQPSDESCSEPELVRAAQAGDKRAFQQLVSGYDGMVLTLALNLTRSELAARAIYERVLLHAFQAIPAKELEQSLFLWMYRIAAQCCHDFLLHQERRIHPLPSRASQSSEAVRCRLGDLSIRERLVFVLFHHAHLRARTIVEILNVPERSAKDALVRAVYKLRAGTEHAS